MDMQLTVNKRKIGSSPIVLKGNWRMQTELGKEWIKLT